MAVWHYRRGQRQAIAAARGSGSPTRIALVGCGAIAKSGHFPALRALGIEPALVVDTDPSRLQSMRRVCGDVETALTLDSRWDDFDAAIVAVPPSAHALVCETLLAAGKHVLVEKPIATDTSAARRILAARTDSAGSVYVAHMRRFLAVNQWVRRVIASGELGSILSVVAEEGVVYAWEGATADHFRPETSGGGVLLDIGVHTLDVLTWWLGSLELTRYRDDNLGGVEANAVLSLSAPRCERVELELSRSRNLRNSVRLRAERGDIELSLHANRVITRPRLPRSLRPPGTPQSFEDLFIAQIAAWLHAIGGSETELASAAEAAAVIELIEACYDGRADMPRPWSTTGRHEAANV